MMKLALRALLATIVLAAITGLLFPLAITAIAQAGLAHDANGSLIERNGTTVGSEEIGQAWSGSEWFHGRPSAVGNDASASGASNLGPTSAVLSDAIARRVDAVLALEGPYTPGLTAADVPVDLVTASASGLDPDISPAAAAFQAPRIAAVRHLSLEAVRQMIADHTEGPALGFLGEPHVNVLELNLALDDLAPIR